VEYVLWVQKELCCNLGFTILVSYTFGQISSLIVHKLLELNSDCLDLIPFQLSEKMACLEAGIRALGPSR
jgi:hypothetical protein